IPAIYTLLALFWPSRRNSRSVHVSLLSKSLSIEISLPEATMKNINTTWLTISICTIGLFLLGSCQRSPQSVQAAREAPGVTNENPAKTGHDALLNKGDREFMRRAEDFDLQQRNLGRFILEKSQNSDVRNYAKMLVDDHTKNLHNAVALMEDK